MSPSTRASKDTLLEKLIALGAILYNMRERSRTGKKVTSYNIRYLLNNFLEILMAKYKVPIEEEVTDNFQVFRKLLSSPSSALYEGFYKDLRIHNQTINEVQQTLDDLNSFLTRKLSPESIEQIMTKMSDFYNLILGVLTVPEANDIIKARRLLAQLEDSHLEFKSSMKWNYKDKRGDKDLMNVIAKEIAGFMNSDGGTLMIGVKDDGNVLGLEKDFSVFQGRSIREIKDSYQRTFDDIVSKRLGGKRHAYMHQLVERKFVPYDDKVIFVVEVQKSSTPVYATDGVNVKFYVRIQNATVPFNIREAIEYYEIHFLGHSVTDNHSS